MVEVALPCAILDAVHHGQEGTPSAERLSPTIAHSPRP